MDKRSLETEINNQDLASFTDQIVDYFARAREAGISENEKVIIIEREENISRQTEITPRRIVQYENGKIKFEEGRNVRNSKTYAALLRRYLREILRPDGPSQMQRRIEIKYQEEKSYSLIRGLQR